MLLSIENENQPENVSLFLSQKLECWLSLGHTFIVWFFFNFQLFSLLFIFQWFGFQPLKFIQFTVSFALVEFIKKEKKRWEFFSYFCWFCSSFCCLFPLFFESLNKTHCCSFQLKTNHVKDEWAEPENAEEEERWSEMCEQNEDNALNFNLVGDMDFSFFAFKIKQKAKVNSFSLWAHFFSFVILDENVDDVVASDTCSFSTLFTFKQPTEQQRSYRNKKKKSANVVEEYTLTSHQHSQLILIINIHEK